MPAEIPKFSTADFRKIPENLSHIFDANLTHFLPEWKIYVFTEKIKEKLSELLAEIPGGAGPKPYFYRTVFFSSIISFKHSYLSYCDVTANAIVCMCVKLEFTACAFLTNIFTFRLFVSKQLVVLLA